ncbi:T9SS type A sorting domain-containing protein, partial [uncultured Chryseobacterium sp.]|uniref:fibronectin type III domain-containing protein n=1 Tax=uncultured Chryseobacterium sp. TaxID=259322 RepID=UPI002612A7DC
YGNCVSGTSTATGQVGVRGADGRGDVNNRTGTNWTSTNTGTANTSNCTLGTSNGATVPASGLTFLYSPGTWIAAPTTYATLPFNEDFSTWANGNSTADLPNATYWRSWPSRGNNSWRQNDIATGSVGFTSASGWENNTEGTATTISSPAVAPTARFHSYYASSGLTGNMDLYVDLSTGGAGVRILSFDYRNSSGSDKLDILLSTDGGGTFSNVGTVTTNSAWTRPSFVLNSNAANAVVRLAATSDYGSTDIFVDNLSIEVSTVTPACTTISAPANAATGVSLTPDITWAASSGASSYKINIGTTPGGTDVMNSVDVGNVTTYSVPAGSQLLYGQSYYVTVLPSNANGTATGCTEISFTTKNIGCPVVSAPAVNATNVSLTPTITWATVTDAIGYKLTVGTTAGGSDVLNNLDLGNVTTYTFSTALNNSTSYYYVVNAYTANNTSVSCTERVFTTVCQPYNAPYTEDFDATSTGSTSNTNAPTCWSYLETSGSAGYGYVSSTSPASSPNCFYLYNSSATSGNIMLVSPQTNNLSDGTKRVKFMAKGSSNSYALQVGTLSDPTNPATFSAIGSSITLTNSWAQYIVDIPVGTDLNLAFRHGLGGTYRSIYIDDVTVESIPACVEPTGITVASITYKAATVSWTASSSAPSGNYDLFVSTTNTAPAPGATPTVSNVTSPYTLTPLTPSTSYYVWVRSNCGTSTSDWAPAPAFATSSFCPSVTAPAANAANVSLTPTITWSAASGATGYKITMGTTPGGTDILDNVDVGNVTTYTLATPLNNSTSYFYTVNAYDAEVSSQSCTVRVINTICTPITPSYTNSFNAHPGACWANASGGTPATGSTGTTSYWTEDGFLNNGTTGAVKYNSYSTGRAGWLKTPIFDLSAGGYRVKFNYGLTEYGETTPDALGSDDVIHFLVSQDGGTTWTILQTWDAANSPSNASNNYSLDLTSYTSANTMFAFYGNDGSVNDDNDVDFFVDNFIVEPMSTMGTSDIAKKNDIKVYPNPFVDNLNISDIANVKSVNVMDVAGRLVKTIETPGSVLYLGELKTGMYLVVLIMKDGSKQTVKVIKK